MRSSCGQSASAPKGVFVQSISWIRWFISLRVLGTKVILPFLDVSQAYMGKSQQLKSAITLWKF
jgi:hypothetical protein